METWLIVIFVCGVGGALVGLGMTFHERKIPLGEGLLFTFSASALAAIAVRIYITHEIGFLRPVTIVLLVVYWWMLARNIKRRTTGTRPNE